MLVSLKMKLVYAVDSQEKRETHLDIFADLNGPHHEKKRLWPFARSMLTHAIGIGIRYTRLSILDPVQILSQDDRKGNPLRCHGRYAMYMNEIAIYYRAHSA